MEKKLLAHRNVFLSNLIIGIKNAGGTYMEGVNHFLMDTWEFHAHRTVIQTEELHEHRHAGIIGDYG